MVDPFWLDEPNGVYLESLKSKACRVLRLYIGFGISGLRVSVLGFRAFRNVGFGAGLWG